MQSWSVRAGFFLFAVQPFKLGDRVAVSPPAGAPSPAASWFEGICEKVDLRCSWLAAAARAPLPGQHPAACGCWL